MTKTTHTIRAPYQVEDHVQVLYGHPRHGTCLARAVRVVTVARTDERAAHPWTITYRLGPGDGTYSVRVDADGFCANRYVQPSTSVLTLEESWTEHGQIATALATALRRAGVPGPLATTTGGNNFAVVITWPSGNDQVVIGVDIWDGSPHLHVAAYEDREHDAPAHEHTVNTIPAAVTEVVRLLATHAER